jgi:hypothetical protein
MAARTNKTNGGKLLLPIVSILHVLDSANPELAFQENVFPWLLTGQLAEQTRGVAVMQYAPITGSVMSVAVNHQIQTLMATTILNSIKEERIQAEKSRQLLDKFIANFFDDIKSKLCKGTPHGKTGYYTNASLSALAGWFVLHLGLHSPLAFGLAAAILISVTSSFKKSLCKMSIEDYLDLLGISLEAGDLSKRKRSTPTKKALKKPPAS